MTHETQIIIKLALAALFGASIGIERELKHKPMGLRTNVLIAMTGSLVMIMASEMTRLTGSDAQRAALGRRRDTRTWISRRWHD